MALFFWQYGEESMAKALVARKLYRAMSNEAQQSSIIDDSSEQLNTYSKEFGQLAVELLDKCFKENELMAMKLLTYELRNWSKSTCLKLAVSSRLRMFVTHTCTQLLLSDMWMGRLNVRKYSSYKVILSILLPPMIPLLDYKTKAQMSHIPQSQNDHQMTLDDKEETICSAEGIALEAFRETAFSDGTSESSTGMRTEGKSKRLPIARRFYAFYHAPIVKFWFNTLAFLAFLMLYCYVVLVKMENVPSVQEWIVISFILTTGVEKIREILMSEANKVTQKLRIWASSYLNINDAIAIITFLIGFGLRFAERKLVDNDLPENYVFIAGRMIYCLNTIFWCGKLMDILNVNQDAGPYVLMIGKMVSNMFYIVVIMGIVIVAFGVPRKAILYPHEEPSWSLAKDVVFQPYFMTYGEVYAYEIDVCANNSVVPQLCAPGTWLTPILQALYLFVQYIILVNLLIALFNNVYMQYKGISNTLWKFQRYHFIKVYHEKPVLPPPLVIFSHMASFISWMCKCERKYKSYGPKLHLTEEDQKKLHEFEEHCVGIYFIDNKDENNSKPDERIRVTTERVEHVSKEMDEVGEQVMFIKRSLRSLDNHIGHLQDLSGLTLDSLKTLTAQKALESSRSRSVMSCDMSLPRHNSHDGRSATWKKSNSDLLWGCTFPQHSHSAKSQRKINITDANLANNCTVDSVPAIHKEIYCDEKNIGVNNQKRKTSHPIVFTEQGSLQVPSKSESKSQAYTKSTRSRIATDQIFSPCPEGSSFGKYSCNKEGYVNSGFIDDKGNSPDFYEKNIKDSELFKSLGSLLQEGT
ncbi:hypothetical protein GDO86_006328, partial [Hymenochirus boettgeri]